MKSTAMLFILKKNRSTCLPWQTTIIFTNLKSHFKKLCIYVITTKKMSEKYFLWAIGKKSFVYEVLYYVYVHVHWDFVC